MELTYKDIVPTKSTPNTRGQRTRVVFCTICRTKESVKDVFYKDIVRTGLKIIQPTWDTCKTFCLCEKNAGQ